MYVALAQASCSYRYWYFEFYFINILLFVWTSELELLKNIFFQYRYHTYSVQIETLHDKQRHEFVSSLFLRLNSDSPVSIYKRVFVNIGTHIHRPYKQNGQDRNIHLSFPLSRDFLCCQLRPQIMDFCRQFIVVILVLCVVGDIGHFLNSVWTGTCNNHGTVSQNSGLLIPAADAWVSIAA